MMHIVIAKYKEDIKWLHKFNYSYTVYNKGPEIEDKFTINIPNTGRESETYLRYIIENYGTLPECTLFVQGNPYPHCSNLEEQLSNYRGEPYYFVGRELIYDFENGAPHHPGLNIAEIAKLLGIYTGKERYYFVPGAQFIVKSETIKRRSLEWWKQAYEIHNKFHSSPWVYERLWGDIFAV